MSSLPPLPRLPRTTDVLLDQHRRRPACPAPPMPRAVDEAAEELEHRGGCCIPLWPGEASPVRVAGARARAGGHGGDDRRQRVASGGPGEGGRRRRVALVAGGGGRRPPFARLALGAVQKDMGELAGDGGWPAACGWGEVGGVPRSRGQCSDAFGSASSVGRPDQPSPSELVDGFDDLTVNIKERRARRRGGRAGRWRAAEGRAGWVGKKLVFF
jgi:hypothetical protein